MGAALSAPRVLVVANPVAGGGRGRPGSLALCERLAAAGWQVERFETDGPDAARRRLSDSGAELAELHRLAVVGGDGTLNDVLDALPDPGRVPLAQLALGTANMLARELNLPRTPEGVANMLLDGGVRRMDLARANDRRFFGNASCGFDSRLVHRIARERRGTLPGMWAYVAPAFGCIRGYREPRLAVHLENGRLLHAGLVIATNLKNYGGVFTLSRTAVCDSGFLELCVLERGRIPDLLGMLAGGALGLLDRTPGVSHHRVRRARIESLGEPFPVQVDGDARGETPLELSLEPSAVPIVVPAQPSDAGTIRTTDR